MPEGLLGDPAEALEAALIRNPDIDASCLTAVVLAGGHSRRIKQDKACLDAGGRRLINTVLETVCRVTDDILISTGTGGPIDGIGFPAIADHYRGRGPLAGLHAGMLATRRTLILLLACDMPAVTENLLRNLLAAIADFDAVVPRTPDGRIHPLCAVYRRSCLPVVERRLQERRNAMREMLADEQLRVRFLEDCSTLRS